MMRLLLICAALVLLFQIRVRLTACYDRGDFWLRLRVGPVKILLYPRKKDPEKERKEQAKKAAKQRKKAPEGKPKRGVSLELIRVLLPALTQAAGQFRRKLHMDELTLEVTWGETDPADAAIHYGYAWAAVGTMLPPLENCFQIKKKKVDMQLDYRLERPEVFAKTILSLTLWQLLCIGATAGVKGFRAYRSVQKEKTTSPLERGREPNERKKAV